MLNIMKLARRSTKEVLLSQYPKRFISWTPQASQETIERYKNLYEASAKETETLKSSIDASVKETATLKGKLEASQSKTDSLKKAYESLLAADKAHESEACSEIEEPHDEDSIDNGWFRSITPTYRG